MHNPIATNISESARDFQHLVWPLIRKLGWLKGELIPVEATSTKDWSEQLDMLAGIDAWERKPKGLTGIASRVQWRPRYDKGYPYNTFNIRMSRVSGADTEFKKRIQAIHSGGELIYPYWTCHAYLEAKIVGPVLSVGLIRTEDLLECISLGLGFNKSNHEDGTIFQCIKFIVLYNEKVPIQVEPSSILKQGMLSLSDGPGQNPPYVSP